MFLGLTQCFFISFFLFILYFLCSPTIELKFVRCLQWSIACFFLLAFACLLFVLTFEQLFILFILLLFGQVLCLLIFSYVSIAQFKKLAFFLSCFLFSLSLVLVGKFCLVSQSTLSIGFIGLVTLDWLSAWNIHYSLGVDGLSVFFVVLTTFLTSICILVSWYSIKYRVKEFLLLLAVVELLLCHVFLVLDIFYFFLCFESVLIPMFFLIGIWGSRQRKMHAVLQFFLYTMVGSILMLCGIFFLYFETGSTHFFVLLSQTLAVDVQYCLWLAFFVSFAIKVPMFPFHIWLPEAHVEAPTSGSILLAGVLLKMGTYGFFRFMVQLTPEACLYFSPLIFVFCIIAIIYSSFSTIRQIDLKKIIAYASIGHMNFVILGLFTFNVQGLAGSVFLMLSHGIVSSALFACIGSLYDRYRTRIIFYYKGLVQYMPMFSVFLFFFTLGNVSFPGTSSFIGELLILVGLLENNFISTVLAAIGIILGLIYSFWLYNRIIFGNTSKALQQYLVLPYYADLSVRECCILSCFSFFMFLGGFFPNIFLDFITMVCVL